MEKLSTAALITLLRETLKRHPRLREVHVTTCPNNVWICPVLRCDNIGRMKIDKLSIEMKPIKCAALELGYRMLELLDEADIAAGLSHPRDLRGKETILAIHRKALSDQEHPQADTQIIIEIGVGFEELPRRPTTVDETK